LSYREHLWLVGPAALAGLAINHGLLWAMFRRVVRDRRLETPGAPEAIGARATLTLGVIAATAGAYVLGGHLAWTAATGFAVLMLLHRRDTRLLWARIDWSLLLFFASLFVVVEGLMKGGVPAALFARYSLAGTIEGPWAWFRLSGIFLVGSNVVSNVPFILVVREQMSTLADPRFGWELLAMASTFAGNLTLLGSAANIIVAEAARDVGGIGFWQYLRVGLPIACLTTIAGTLWLVVAG
jgi:Na+/H+ antiporter NhaD/arsenite permease-like protein